MQSDSLEHLLKQADATAQPSAGAGELAECCLVMVRRRRRSRSIIRASAAVAILVGGLSWWLLPHHRPVPQPKLIAQAMPPSPDAAQLTAELQRLRREADWRMDLAMRLMREEEQSRPPGRAAAPAEPIDQQVEYAAFTMVYQADRMSKQLGLPKPAEELYRQCAQAFPKTQWAQVARQRLGS